MYYHPLANTRPTTNHKKHLSHIQPRRPCMQLHGHVYYSMLYYCNAGTLLLLSLPNARGSLPVQNCLHEAEATMRSSRSNKLNWHITEPMKEKSPPTREWKSLRIRCRGVHEGDLHREVHEAEATRVHEAEAVQRSRTKSL